MSEMPSDRRRRVRLRRGLHPRRDRRRSHRQEPGKERPGDCRRDRRERQDGREGAEIRCGVFAPAKRAGLDGKSYPATNGRKQQARKKTDEQFNAEHERAGAEILALTALDAAENILHTDPKNVTSQVKKMIREAARAWAEVAAKLGD